MRFGFLLGLAIAFLLHGLLLGFGGMPFRHHGAQHAKVQQVELVSAVEEEREKPKPEEPEEEPEEQPEAIDDSDAPPPDVAQVVRQAEMSANAAAPELEAASLSAIEAALSGQFGGGGDFAESLSFASGGRIGGKGKAGTAGAIDDAFNMSDIDQKPRVLYQSAPTYPSGMRNIEGSVTLIFIVEVNGRVSNVRVEKSTNAAFEKPALDAIKQWRFEPASKGGKKVPSKMRIPIRFQPKQ